MPTNRRVRTRAWTPHLSAPRRQALLTGPESVLLTGSCDYFGGLSSVSILQLSPAAYARFLPPLRRDWEVHGDDLLAWWLGEADAEDPTASPWFRCDPGGPGTRPWAWWRFDAPEPQPEGEPEAIYLARLGLFLRGERPRLQEAGR